MSEMPVLLSVSAQDLSRLSLKHELECFDVVIVTHSWFKRISCLGNRLCAKTLIFVPKYARQTSPDVTFGNLF